MKKMYKYLKLFPVILLGLNFSASAQSVLFSYTGAVQNYVVPVGVTTINVVAEGGNGASCFGNYSQGGKGGRSVCDMTVTAGQTLYVYVGASGGSGGWNGGGAGAGNGGIGGGASDVRTGTGLALSDRVIVAGGGGGAGYDCAVATNLDRGGQGGSLTGETGYLNSLFPLSSYAYGGDQIGGSGGMVGLGAGAIGNGGGGGGGYYGGIAGTNVGPGLSVPGCPGGFGGGGGGSSYGNLSVLTSAVHNIGGNTNIINGNGSVTICAPGIAGTIKALDSLCVGTLQTLTNPTGTAGGTWSVTSAGGTATINAITGDINPTAAGMIIVKYDITSPCGNATATRYMMVRDYPPAISGILSTCTGTTTTLSDATTGGTWASTLTAIATVGTSSGVVSGLTAGTTIISYSDHGCAVGSIFTVIQGPDTIIGPDNICVASSIQFSDATPLGTWSTSALTTQATINSSTGVLTGVSSGPVIISYTVGSCFSTKIVMVNDTPGTIFGTNTLCAGDNTTLVEFGIGGTWSARFPLIADVNSSGTVTAFSGGPDTIYYTIPGCTPKEFPMTIDQAGPILGITSVCKGTAIPLTDTSAGIWSSSDTNIAIIDAVTGLLRDGLLATVGSTATITFTVPAGCFSTLNVTVNTSAPPITGPDTVCKGATAALTDATTGGTWSSTDLSIAQIVDTSGIISGISAGIVNVSYTLYSGCFSTRSFRVKPLINALTGLVRTPTNDTICEGVPVHIYADPAFAGSGPTFKWSLFGITKGTTDTFDYTPKHGDVIVVEMTVGTGVCATSGVVKDSVTYDVDSIKAPTISISRGSPTSDTISFLGQEYTFNSTVHYGGEDAKYQWYRNGKAISGATNIYYKTEVYYTDTFFCIVTGNPPCVAPSSVGSNGIVIYNFLYKLDTKTISDAGTMLTLFPNPTKGTLTLTGTVAGNTNEDISIEISDMLGRIVYTGSTAPVNGKLNKEITLDNSIADGTYMMRVNTAHETNVLHFVVNK